MNGSHVGTWSVDGGKHEFVYAASWLSNPLSRPISLSMPLRKGVLSGAVVESFFDNLLPNSDAIRQRVRDRYKIGSTRPFDMLRAIGRDCVGAKNPLA